MSFTELADRVWVARHAWFDVNVALVAGTAGAVLVDTGVSSVMARQIGEDLRSVWSGPLLAVVNTHAHGDHVLGNAELRREHPGIPIHAHEATAEGTEAAVAEFLADDVPADDPRRAEVLATPVLPADHTFSSATVLDLGDRQLELVHPGRGHTAGDLVVRVPDVDVLLAGDLVEESAARDAVPSFGPDCFPLEWPLTLDLVLSLVGDATTVVPGHGAPVDRDFVVEQRHLIGVVAETVRDLATRGVPVGDALASAEWPFPAAELEQAVRRAYAHLPRSQRRLPLI